MDQFTRKFAANNNETTLRYWTVPLLHKNLRGATLSSKDIPISPYTKGENNNNIVSSLTHLKMFSTNMRLQIIYDTYKDDSALNNLQGLICHKS